MRAFREGSFSRRWSRFMRQYDRPQLRFQQGQSSQSIQASLQASESSRQSYNASGQSGSSHPRRRRRSRDKDTTVLEQTRSSQVASERSRVSDIDTTGHSIDIVMIEFHQGTMSVEHQIIDLDGFLCREQDNQFLDKSTSSSVAIWWLRQRSGLQK